MSVSTSDDRIDRILRDLAAARGEAIAARSPEPAAFAKRMVGHDRWSLQIEPRPRFLPMLLAAALLLAALIGFAVGAGSRFVQDERDEIVTQRGAVEPFIGLPPEGATPSIPEKGDLVLTFAGRVLRLADGNRLDVHMVWVYADGRILWKRNLEVSSGEALRAFGTSEPTTALIEQRLSPEGVELLRTTVLAAGLTNPVPGGKIFTPPELRGSGVVWGGLVVNDGSQLIKASWSDGSLPMRLADPASWLPAWAWVDERIGGYVPTLYAVCFDPQLEDRLPPPVRDILAVRSRGAVANDVECRDTVTIENARLLASALDDAGFARLPDLLPDTAARPAGVPRALLEYRIVPAGAGESEVGDFIFSPVLPHNEVACFGCG